MQYPWKIGDLAMYFENLNITRNDENAKKAVIVGFQEKGNMQYIDILVEGKVLTVSPRDLQVPRVRKIKSTFYKNDLLNFTILGSLLVSNVLSKYDIFFPIDVFPHKYLIKTHL